MTQKIIPPVLLIVFNRPTITKAVFESIKEVKPKKLYIAADGPRKNREGEAQKCEEVRKIVRSVDWECEVYTDFSSENLGCKQRVSSAINWFFMHEESGIILEDDCLPHKSFFAFCGELLERYKDNHRVGMISGNNFQFGKIKNNHSYYFSRYTHTWGWATWRRAWVTFDLELKDYPKNKEKALEWLKDKRARIYWDTIFTDIYTGQMDKMGLSVWDYQWTYAAFLNNFISIMPSVNLISNIGFGEDMSTHTKRKGKFSFMQTYEMEFPLMHPESIAANGKSDLLTQKNNYQFFRFFVSRFIKKIKLSL